MIDNDNKTHRQLVKEYGRVQTKQMLLRGNSFAIRLHTDIAASGYTRQRLADIIQCSKAALDKWLAGDQYPAAHFVWRLAMALHPDYDNFGEIITGSTINAELANIEYVKQISNER